MPHFLPAPRGPPVCLTAHWHAGQRAHVTAPEENPGRGLLELASTELPSLTVTKRHSVGDAEITFWTGSESWYPPSTQAPAHTREAQSGLILNCHNWEATKTPSSR